MQGVGKYKAELKLLKLMRACVSEKDIKGNKEHLNVFLVILSNMIKDFKGFKTNKGTINDLVREDRKDGLQ